jgi:hypothetical protein
MNTRMRWMLKCLAPDNDSGGGASEDDKPMSRKDMLAEINKAVTGATKNWGERISKSLSETTAKLVQEGQAPILAKLEELAKASPAGGGGESKGDGKDAVSPEIKTQLAKAEQAAKEAKDGQLALEKRLKEKDQELENRTINSELTKALIDAGVRSEHTDALILLHRASGNIIMQDGAPVAKVKREGYEDVLSLSDAMKEWVKTPKGKLYLPPVDVHGTGDNKIPINGRGDGSGFGPLLTGSSDDQTMAALNILSQTK